MRIKVEIDDQLLIRAMAVAGLSSECATIEEGLRRLVRACEQSEALTDLAGLGWEGDLDEMRQGHRPPPA